MQMALMAPVICGAPSAHAMAADPLAAVDPELRDVARWILNNSWFQWDPKVAPSVRRLNPPKFPRPKPAVDIPVSEITVPGSRGQPSVRTLMVGAGTAERLRPAIICVHGGGFILGTPDDGTVYLQDLARLHDCLVLSPDYRLAPETAFPGAREDVYAVLAYLNREAARLKIDPSRILILGGSAGGGLAAQVALAVRDRKEFALAGQALVYPMLDDRTGSTRTAAPTVGKIGWNAEMNRVAWTYYLGVPAGSERIPEGAVPARISDLSGLAPAFIGVGDLDLFVEESVDYARRLIAAGVETELVTAPGAFHSFDTSSPTAAVSRRFNASLHAFITRHLA